MPKVSGKRQVTLPAHQCRQVGIELVSCPINKCDSEWAQSPRARRSPQGISGILPRAATEPSARRREGHPRKNVGRRLCPLPKGAQEKGCGPVPCDDASLGNTAKYCLLQRLATALLLRAEPTLIYGTGH